MRRWHGQSPVLSHWGGTALGTAGPSTSSAFLPVAHHRQASPCQHPREAMCNVPNATARAGSLFHAMSIARHGLYVVLQWSSHFRFAVSIVTQDETGNEPSLPAKRPREHTQHAGDDQWLSGWARRMSAAAEASANVSCKGSPESLALDCLACLGCC